MYGLLVVQFRGLLGGHDDIFIVREHEDLIAVDAVKGGNEALSGRVHALAAFDDLVRAEFLEDLHDARAICHGYDAVFFMLLDLAGGVAGELRLVVLKAHVLDLQLQEFAVLADV